MSMYLSLVHLPISANIRGQTKREAVSFLVALILGCESECNARKTVKRKVGGTTGRGLPVEVSQIIDWLALCRGIDVRDRES